MLDIFFISDYVCPYCLVAEEALKRALEETHMEASITFRPRELSPEGTPQVDTYHDEVKRERYKILLEPCRQMDLHMALPPAIVPRPRTRLALEGRFYAAEQGCEAAYNDRMYRAYFTEERDIGNLDVLTDLAAEVGLDAAEYRRCLETGCYAEAERQLDTETKRLYENPPIPAIFMDGVRVRPERYTVEEMRGFLLDAEERTLTAESSGFTGCGPNGCG